ncbi:hypothetical protein [Actinomyces minihominis]|uniref:hypothetical protein n=1 Tax=Actinomyces minihominis TaxID=2002838 RepID=UPI000C086996|nr:hypothetical protein [Actinomyces minihominis]
MSDHHHSDHKENLNRMERRGEAEAVHVDDLDLNTELQSDPNLGEFTKDEIQTGAGKDTPGENPNREWAVDEREAQKDLDDRS